MTRLSERAGWRDSLTFDGPVSFRMPAEVGLKRCCQKAICRHGCGVRRVQSALCLHGVFRRHRARLLDYLGGVVQTEVTVPVEGRVELLSGQGFNTMENATVHGDVVSQKHCRELRVTRLRSRTPHQLAGAVPHAVCHRELCHEAPNIAADVIFVRLVSATSYEPPPAPLVPHVLMPDSYTAPRPDEPWQDKTKDRPPCCWVSETATRR